MNGLDPFRRRLDALDEGITRLLGERFEVCREIAHYKRAHDIPMCSPTVSPRCGPAIWRAALRSICRRTSSPTSSSC